MPGWALGASYAYAWDAKPADMATPDAYYDPDYRLKESAQPGCYVHRAGWPRESTMFKLHFTQYDNHSDIPSYAGGYGNIFQDERDVKFMVIAPFTIF
jgi:hypothetical protein